MILTFESLHFTSGYIIRIFRSFTLHYMA